MRQLPSPLTALHVSSLFDLISCVRLQRFIPEEERLRELNETLTATAAEAARKIETESDKTRLDSASDRMSPKLESWLATEKVLLISVFCSLLSNSYHV